MAGPPGLGKTMVAAGLGLHAVNNGYTVCFEKMVNLVKILDTAETERSAGFRLKNLKKAQLIIIDEIGYTPIEVMRQSVHFECLCRIPVELIMDALRLNFRMGGTNK